MFLTQHLSRWQYMHQNCSCFLRSDRLAGSACKYLSNEHLRGGKRDVISHKFLLVGLLQDFSQLLVCTLQVLGKLGFCSFPICMVLEARCFMCLYPFFFPAGKASRWNLGSIGPLCALLCCLLLNWQTGEIISVSKVTAAFWACQHKMAYTLHTSDKHDGY